MLGILHQNQVATVKVARAVQHLEKGIAFQRDPLLHDHKSIAFPRHGSAS